MGNAMIAKRQGDMENSYLIGRGIWQQLVSDIITEILADEEVMGKGKTIDPVMILRINKEIERRCDYYDVALGTDLKLDADVRRSQLDANMKAVVDAYNEARPVGEEAIPFIPFEERIPWVNPFRYDKPVKEDRHPATRKHGKRRKH